jgi:hypothetical protein
MKFIDENIQESHRIKKELKKMINNELMQSIVKESQ